MDAYKAGDTKTGNKRFADSKPMYEKALAKCDKTTIQDPIAEWVKKVEDMTKADDWETEEKKIYEKNKAQVDEDVKYEFYFWFD